MTGDSSDGETIPVTSKDCAISYYIASLSGILIMFFARSAVFVQPTAQHLSELARIATVGRSLRCTDWHYAILRQHYPALSRVARVTSTRHCTSVVQIV